MARGLDDLDNIGMEDAGPLDAIIEMASKRVSAVRFTGRYIYPITFRGQTPLLKKLERLREIVETLAPNFVDMDYPYWDLNWVMFPTTYTVDQIHRDREHGLNVLPASLSSFDDQSITVYRTFLKNVVYWLGKFRYQVGLLTYYDKTFKRSWSWNDWSPWGRATENGESVDKDLAALKSSQVGIVKYSEPRYLNTIHGFSVSINEFVSQSKNIFLDRNTGPYENIENEHSYSIENVPQNLITNNPTAYRAKVLWFIVPNGWRNRMRRNFDPYVVTNVSAWVDHHWGPNNQNTATEYTPSDGYSENREEEAHRGQFLECSFNRRSKNARQIRETNWSDDGTRSAVIRDETTPQSDSIPSTNWNETDFDEFEGFGRVALTSAPPCFEAGTVEPHGKLTFHVCDQNALPAPSYTPPNPVHLGTYCFGVGSIAWAEVDADTRWIPILDFGDYEIPQPEED